VETSSFITRSSRVKNLGPDTDYPDVFHNSPQSLQPNVRIVKVFLVLWEGRVPDVKKSQNVTQALLATCFIPISCLNFSLKLKMDATHYSEISADFQRITRRYIPEDRNLNNCSSFSHVPLLQTHIITPYWSASNSRASAFS
jgi:hypothetical protein